MQEIELLEPYQILDPDGKVVGPLPEGLENHQLLLWYRTMWLTRLFSNKIIALQRQGQATTWIPTLGQEASGVGMATSLQPQDWLAGSPREIGGYFLKGVPPAAVAYFVRGTPPPAELFKGQPRCLPLTIVIGTQTLHSVGLAMAAKIKGENSVVVGSCGDGATSEGDFNEALNFAGVFKAPVVLYVVNNGWSISVPRSKQSVAKYLALRGLGVGIPFRVVDGNDILAIYSVMKEAVERARAGDGPTLVEAITFRRGAHSTADDPSRYCPPEELLFWEKRDPIKRFRQFLLDQNILDESGDTKLVEEVEEELAEQIKLAYNYPLPRPDSLFDNVYGKLTPRLERQRELMRRELTSHI